KNEEKLLNRLSGGLSHGNQESCPSLEDISALIDGVLKNEMKESVQNHIASCNICYETYLTASELNKSSIHTSSRIFSPWAIAASVFIALVSFVIFYKVNVSVKNEVSHISEISKNPLVEKESLPETIKDKERMISPASLKTVGKKLDKAPAPKKSGPGKKKSKQLAFVEESRPDREEPAGRNISRKVEPGNVQGMSQSWNEPVKAPPVVSTRVGKVEFEYEDQKPEEVNFRRKKGGKGLVDKLSEDERKGEGKSDNFNCFRKKGDEYTRHERFRSSLPFEKYPPVVLRKIQPGDIPGLKKNLSGEKFTLEVTTDGEGNILKLCLLAGDEMKIREIIAAFRLWKFVLPGSTPVRFRVILGLTSEGLLEILNKK
ncbi:MAG: hypothetical protein KAS97_09085, partial [Candidatus Aminicenantes bacterium]|nr:hypothetical protein [Candidatus Aminicenantes bacterium]